MLDDIDADQAADEVINTCLLDPAGPSPGRRHVTSLHDCLQRAGDFGAIDRARGHAIRAEYDQLVARYGSMWGMRPAQARARAGETGPAARGRGDTGSPTAPVRLPRPRA
ncbi:hypothetical protein [Albidovulum sp.]|uniref:hypothetical protein n=1 Tax=Albidovulum sp. TaxID=1872424 RepID=UPI00306C1903